MTTKPRLYWSHNRGGDPPHRLTTALTISSRSKALKWDRHKLRNRHPLRFQGYCLTGSRDAQGEARRGWGGEGRRQGGESVCVCVCMWGGGGVIVSLYDPVVLPIFQGGGKEEGKINRLLVRSKVK